MHFASVGSLNEAMAHPRELFKSVSYTHLAYIKVKTENIGYGELTKTDESSGVKPVSYTHL